MKVQGYIISTVTTLKVQEDKPHLLISLAFFSPQAISHGFISGEGLVWLAKILYAFKVNNLEEVVGMDIIIEQDSKETPMKITCKDTQEVLGDIEGSLEPMDAIGSTYEKYKLDTTTKQASQ